MRKAVALALLLALAACGPAQRVNIALPKTGPGSSQDPACAATDQDQFVYRPDRLQVLLACVRVTGTIVASSQEIDGDVHINVRLDEPYAQLLVDGNKEEDGLLIVEPVCRTAPVLAEAIRTCAQDGDPLAGLLPFVGQHVWMEGRYVLDLQHHAWAELHPLYRWGTQP